MRILLLNEYFPPDTSATAKMAAAVVNELARHHQVTVLCGRPSYDPLECHPFYFWRREIRGSVSIERVGSTTFHRRRMKCRLLNYLSYVALSVPRALFIRADLVIAMTDPPFEGIVGAFVALIKRRPFVYNIRDLYPEMAVSGYIVKPARWLKVWEWLHRWALRRAARVVVLGEDTEARIKAKNISPGRIVVIRDGAERASTVPLANHPVTCEVRSGYSFVVLHAGNIGFYGAWGTIVQAAQSMNGDDVGFVFVGDGAMKSRIEISANGCKAIRFLPYRPVSEVPYVLAAGDLHIVTIRRGLEGVVVPSKLYPILAAGRPVLALAPEESDAARIIRRSGCGVVANPDDPAEVARLIRELATDTQRLAAMRSQACMVAAEFSFEKELKRFVNVVGEAA